MKRRMCVCRGCCGSVCASFTETTWTDDFSSYTTGEDLSTHGYSGSIVEENGGGIEGRFIVLTTNGFATRLFRLDFTKWDTISFEAEFLSHSGGATASGNIGLFTDQFGPSVGHLFSAGNSITARWPGGTSNYTRSYGYNDTFKTVMTITNVDRVTTEATELTFDVDYYHNTTNYHTETDIVWQLNNTDWCASYYGHSGNDLTTDNWDFSIS